jgi:hypothetical protein
LGYLWLVEWQVAGGQRNGMKIKHAVLSSAATFFVTALTFVSTAQAGGAGARSNGPARVSPGNGGNNTQPIVSPSSSSARTNRGGADDPANHDVGDDRGRHRGGGGHRSSNHVD